MATKFHPKLTELERAIKLLDEMICLEPNLINSYVGREAMKMIASARKKNSAYPITMRLSSILSEKGLLK